MARLDGIERLKKALEARERRYAAGIARGLKKAGAFLLRQSLQEVPVQFGVLRSSGTVRSAGSGMQTVVFVGYQAKYALYVHENLEAAHGTAFNVKHADKIAAAKTPAEKRVWFNRGPKQAAKFLERPLRQNEHELRRIVTEEARKP